MPEALAATGHCSAELVSLRGVCTVTIGPGGEPQSTFFAGDERIAAEPYRVACNRLAAPSDLRAAVSMSGRAAERCYQASFLGDLVTCSVELDADIRIVSRRPEEEEGWNTPLVRGR